jgi:opacity protein-like surface antigen
MKQFLCFVILAFGVCPQSRGQTVEVSVLQGWARMGKAPLGSSSPESPDDSDTKFRNGYSTGLRLTWNPHRYYGYELGYLRTVPTLETKIQPTDDAVKETFRRKVALHQAFFDFLLYWMPKNERLRPYFAAGVHAQKSKTPKNVENWYGHSTRNLGFHYGVGLKVRLFKHAQARFDLREYRTGKPYDLSWEDVTQSGGTIKQQEASVGLGFTF